MDRRSQGEATEDFEHTHELPQISRGQKRANEHGGFGCHGRHRHESVKLAGPIGNEDPGQDAPSASRTVARMERDRLVTRTVAPSDRRAALIGLTRRGLSLRASRDEELDPLKTRPKLRA